MNTPPLHRWHKSLRSGNRLVRAHTGARAAINALVGIDHVGSSLADRLGRAGILAASACNALFRINLVSHFDYSFFVVVSKDGTIIPPDDRVRQR